ncbi:Tyrosyl-DNA phosphodiesterase 1 [Hondaea fermentalgiana]|uniref:Tyrosyl-DNA phosphodiesterase 1 n=1 Tax=Hondaea fermentalgiana TaxID=2315210 RepID=A0A2R5GXI4_9STRA|nr:Tyrosyl-DNA phosphodiesterase 1 [Hondaea fermentalgiana]|eukprot:GBG32674.1 Tyrosyl-DNA phosphodiesterase 1 [Hondaea fermentalgiana]
MCGSSLVPPEVDTDLVCGRCARRNPEAATACISCGSNLRNEDRTKWPVHGFLLNEIHDREGQRVAKGPLERASTASIPALTMELQGLQEAWVLSMDIDPAIFFRVFPAFRELRKLYVFHGMDGGSPFRRNEANRALEQTLRQVNSHVRCFHPPPKPYGKHHSKGFVLFYKDKLRVIVHTANLVPFDLFNKTDAVYYEDFELMREDGVPRGSNRVFGPSLLKYFRAQMDAIVEGMRGERRFADRLPEVASLWKYDFSTAHAALIASVPGTFSAAGATRWGQLALAAHLETLPAEERDWPVVCQFTSFGSQNMTKKHGSQACWALDEFARRALIRNQNADVHFVFPSNLDCRRSIVGYAHGLFFADKQAPSFARIRPRLCSWTAAEAYPSRNLAFPHMKSYFAYDPSDPRRLSWACITSANLSKAAWGNFTQKGDLSIRSWELGVLFTPALCGSGPRRLVASPARSVGAEDFVLPIPIRLPPVPYTASMDDPSSELPPNELTHVICVPVPPSS